jgi:hypothetical protein
MRERSVDLGDVDLVAARSGFFRRECGRRCAREVACSEELRVDAVIDAADPRRPVARLPRQIAGSQHDRRSTVGDRCAVVLAQRRAQVRLREQRVDVVVACDLCVGIRLRVLAAAHRDLGHRTLGGLAAVEHGARLQGREADGVGP